MRLIPALALTAAVPVGYLAFRGFVGSRAALATAAILAANPMLVWYSSDARSYGLFVLTALLSVWAFSAALRRDSMVRSIVWAIASAACIWTHYFGIFLVVGEVAVALGVGSGARRIAVCGVVVGMSAIPLISLALAQSGDERAGFIAKTPLSLRLSESVRQFAMGPNVPRAWLELAGLAVACGSFAVGGWMAWRSNASRRALLLLTTVVFAVPLLLSPLLFDRFYARNVMVALPLAAAVAAPAMLRLRAVPLIAYLALAATASLWVATDWRYEQVDWRHALQRAEQIDGSAPVVSVTALDAPVVETYLARTPIVGGGIRTREAWVIVEPARAAGQRALGPRPPLVLPGFAVRRSLQVEGFRLSLERAGSPTEIASNAPAGVAVFPGGR